MTTPSSPPAPRQARSRATADRLLAATFALLCESGLEGAVIPRIAERAGVSAANIYRRFADKDALVRATILHALRASQAHNESQLARLLVRATLADSARRLVALLLEQYRRQPRLMRALVRFLEQDGDAGFVREARALLRANADLAARALLAAHRDEIAHPDPARGVAFAVMNAAVVVEAFALDPNAGTWLSGRALTATELARELAAGFVARLQAAPPRARAAAHSRTRTRAKAR
ncbi:MAG: TetR/AcrR family transcriptional regulator [Burkholderiaceae bacterium]